MDTLEHPGIVYRGPSQDRRAALAGGPDVWEVVTRLRQLEGSEEERIARNERAIVENREAAEQRQALLA